MGESYISPTEQSADDAKFKPKFTQKHMKKGLKTSKKSRGEG